MYKYKHTYACIHITIHTNINPLTHTQQEQQEIIRLVAYVCMLPRAAATPRCIQQRKEALVRYNIYVCIYIYTYIHLYIHIFLHIFIYIYIHMHVYI
jgi:hypothetical protein